MTSTASLTDGRPRIHLLNLDVDSALAADRQAYTLPRSAAALQEDLSLLPLLWASDGDSIILPAAIDDRRLLEAAESAGVAVERHTPRHANCSGGAPSPWGWCRAAAATFRRAGVSASLLPDEERLDAMRALSHRRTSCRICGTLSENYGWECPNDPVEVTSLSALRDTIKARGEDNVIIKLPHSGSGRGVIPLASLTPQRAQAIVTGALRRQGSVIVETRCRKRADFSMLFHAGEDGRVRMRALGLFLTDGPRYIGSVIASDDFIAASLGVEPRQLRQIAGALEETLMAFTATAYQGWMGVDMITSPRPDGTLAIVPCIELNLRMTMGVVAALLRSRFTKPHLMYVDRGGAESTGGTPLLAGGGHRRMCAMPLERAHGMLTPPPSAGAAGSGWGA